MNYDVDTLGDYFYFQNVRYIQVAHQFSQSIKVGGIRLELQINLFCKACFSRP